MLTTPRKGYFTIPPIEDESISLLSPSSSQPSTTSTTRNHLHDTNQVPPTPSTLSFLNGEKRYKDQGIVSRTTIISVFSLSLLIFSLLLYLSPSSSPHSPPSLNSIGLNDTVTTIGTNKLFPYTPKDLLNQCHEYYTLDKMPDHSGHYLTSGALDLDEKWIKGAGQDEGICEMSLTYLLDGEKGLFYHLLLIAQSYSIAKLSNRSFFIDDTLWDRGRWTDHFIALPDAGCKRPDAEAMKACPRGTRHWVVSSSTVRYHFAHQYQAYFEDPRGHDVGRKKKMFQMARVAFEEIFIPSETNAKLIEKAGQILIDENGNRIDYIGIHVRRGDRAPMSWKYRNDYIPLEQFVEAVNQSWTQATSRSPGMSSNPTAFISTDAPSIIPSIENFSPNSFHYLSILDSNISSIASLVSPRPYFQSDWNISLPTKEKIFFTRGMIIDFALLTGGWGNLSASPNNESIKRPVSIVCTLSSSVCKLAAVALGWKESFGEMRWINVDGRLDYDWRPTDVMG